MITAQQAREITLNKKKKLPELYGIIKSMAEGGHGYACLKIDEVSEPEKCKQALAQHGFSVETDSYYFKITWP